MKIAEFFALVTLKGGKESVSTLKSMVSTTIAVKSSLISATTALYNMSAAARQSAMFMDMYQLNTGLSTTQLQKLSFQASQAGVSMQELGGTIQKLQQMNANARLGYGWDPILTRFGVTPGQDPVSQLNQISNALKRLGASHPAEAKALASKVGLSDSMYYALMRGTTEQMDKQLIITNKEQQALVKLNQQWNKFWFYIKQIAMKMQALGASFQTGVVRALMRATQGFYELFKRAQDAINASDKLKTVVIALGVAMAAAFAPELLILGAIVLALEDVWTYFEGGDSVTGRIVEWCKQSQRFKDIWLGVKTVFDLVVSAIKMLGELWDSTLSPMIDKIADSKIWPYIEKALSMALNPLASGLEAIGGLRREFGSEDIMRPALATAGGGTMNQNNTTTVYVQSTGNSARDAEIVGDYKREIDQANAQQSSLAIGGLNGGTRYGGK